MPEFMPGIWSSNRNKDYYIEIKSARPHIDTINSVRASSVQMHGALESVLEINPLASLSNGQPVDEMLNALKKQDQPQRS
jgi:hypothetical protein